jgi:hypothetical protein
VYPKQKQGKHANKNRPGFDTYSYLKTIHGVDVTAIYGIGDIAALEILSETGTDRSKRETSKHFVSWLNLCPNNKISGGKVINSIYLGKCRTLLHKYSVVATANKIAAAKRCETKKSSFPLILKIISNNTHLQKLLSWK